MTDPESFNDLDPPEHPHMVTSFCGHVRVIAEVAYLDMGERGVIKLLDSGVLQEYRRSIVEAGIIDESVELEGQRMLMQMHFLDVQGKEEK